MRLTSVVEARNEYYSFELARAARKLAEDVLNVQPGQQVVITADTQSDGRVVWADAAAVYAAGGIPIVLYYHTQEQPNMEPPRAVAAALEEADIWIDHAVMYLMYSEAWHRAIEKGVLYCELGGMDADGMVRCIGKQDINLLAEMGDRVIELLSDAETVRITSGLGTDIHFSNVGIEIGSFKMKANPENIPIMLAGQVSWLPVESSVKGRIVADGILYPPTEVGLLQGTIEFDIEGGRITSIEGDKEARLLQKWIDRLADDTLYRVAHVSLGFNPGIMVPTGRVMEDERAFGDIDFGFGSWVGRPAAGHFDITTRNISLWVNDVQLTADGVFVEPTLAEICRKMDVPGH